MIKPKEPNCPCECCGQVKMDSRTHVLRGGSRCLWLCAVCYEFEAEIEELLRRALHLEQAMREVLSVCYEHGEDACVELIAETLDNALYAEAIDIETGKPLQHEKNPSREEG